MDTADKYYTDGRQNKVVEFFWFVFCLVFFKTEKNSFYTSKAMADQKKKKKKGFCLNPAY